MSVKKVALAASAAMAASTVLFIAQPAQAALVTRCTGVAGAVSVPGDLVVPRDSACTLEGTTVLGNVRVQPGSDLITDGAVINGQVIVASNAYAELIGGTTVGGQLRTNDAYGAYVEDSTIAGRILQTNPNPSDRAPFVLTFGAESASVDSRAGELLLESTSVLGDVSSRDGLYTDIVDSTIDGALTVRTNEFGSVVCESEIYGDALYANNGGTLQIGGSGAVGPCDGASFWGGDVTFNNNTATETGFDISNNIVRGDLTGGGNDPLPTGTGNRVRGEISLPFADAAAAGSLTEEPSAQSLQRQGAAEAVAESRVSELRAKIDERRNAAEDQAAKTPKSKALVVGQG